MKAKACTAAASATPAAKRTKAGTMKQLQVTQPADKPKRSPTPFELRMHKVCQQIPAGRVSTYGALAKVLHSSPRAVGQALRRNPYAPVVPCHRVITADLRLGGFSGSWGEDTSDVKRKKAMLQQEGVDFEGACLADPMLVMAPEDF